MSDAVAQQTRSAAQEVHLGRCAVSSDWINNVFAYMVSIIEFVFVTSQVQGAEEHVFVDGDRVRVEQCGCVASRVDVGGDFNASIILFVFHVASISETSC